MTSAAERGIKADKSTLEVNSFSPNPPGKTTLSRATNIVKVDIPIESTTPGLTFAANARVAQNKETPAKSHGRT
jgi:hypothetical protein